MAFYLGITALSMFMVCAAGLMTETKVVSVGKSVSMDCVVTQDPNVNIYWTIPVGQNLIFIAQAGRSSQNGYIYPSFSNEHFSINYTESWNNTASVFTITIVNASLEDSSSYTCHIYNYDQTTSVHVSKAHLNVVNCSCSVDSYIRCKLDGFNTKEWIPVVVHLDGYYNSAKTHIKPPNEIEINPSTFDPHQVREHGTDILVSEAQNCQTEVNVRCILPANVQASISSAPSSPSTSSTQATMALGNSTARVETSAPAAIPTSSTTSMQSTSTSTTVTTAKLSTTPPILRFHTFLDRPIQQNIPDNIIIYSSPGHVNNSDHILGEEEMF